MPVEIGPSSWVVAVNVLNLLSSAGIVLSDDADVATAGAVATRMIESAIRRSYTPMDQVRILDGTGTRILTPPSRFDSSGNFFSGSLLLIRNVWLLNPDLSILSTLAATVDYRVYPEIGVVIEWLMRLGPAWPIGFQQVKIDGTWGDGILPPPDVLQAGEMMAALLLAGPGIDFTQGGVVTWKQDDQDESYVDSYKKTLADWMNAVNLTISRRRKERSPVGRRY